MDLNFGILFLLLSLCAKCSIATPINLPTGNIIDLGSLGRLSPCDIRSLNLQDLVPQHNLPALNLNNLNQNLNDHLSNLNIDWNNLTPPPLNLGSLGDNLGTNVCGCKQEAPKPHPQPSVGAFPLISHQPAVKPVETPSDCCSCGQQIVAPAPLPRQGSVSDIVKQPVSDCGCGNPVRAPQEYQVYSDDGANIYYQTNAPEQIVTTTPSNPADPISISLARRNHQCRKNMVHEKKLHYGYTKSPIDGSMKQTYREIDEENLYKSNGPELKLRDPQPTAVDNVSYETSEEEEPAAPAPPTVNVNYGPPKLNYQDLGYEEVQPKDAELVIIPSKPTEVQQPQQKPVGSSPSRKDCGCAKNLIIDVSQQPIRQRNHHNNRRHHNSQHNFVLSSSYTR